MTTVEIFKTKKGFRADIHSLEKETSKKYFKTEKEAANYCLKRWTWVGKCGNPAKNFIGAYVFL